MAILLTGGGEVEHYAKLDRQLMKTIDLNSRVLLIPVANDPDDYEDVRERVEDTFGSGISAVDMIEHLGEVSDLSPYAFIYIDGGNTFALLEEIRGSRFTDLARAYLSAGGHIYGDSAGAIVMGVDISTAYIGEAGDDNIAHLQSFHGMGLIESWSVHCHYDQGEDDEIQDLVYSTGSPVIALAEETGVIIHPSSDVEVFGSRPLALFTFTGKTKIAPGETANLSRVLA